MNDDRQSDAIRSDLRYLGEKALALLFTLERDGGFSRERELEIMADGLWEEASQPWKAMRELRDALVSCGCDPLGPWKVTREGKPVPDTSWKQRPT